MTMMPREEYPVKWIPVGELSVIWAQSQRPLNERRVKQIMDAPDPDALGVLTVTLPNGKGVHHIIDGQHRAEAFRRLWGDKEKLPCLILPSKGTVEAANIWLKMNGGRAKPGALDSFRVGVTARYEAETAVNDLTKSLGYRVGLDSKDGVISCVSALLSIHKRHGNEVLKDTLLTIQGCWGRTRDSVQNMIVQGFSEVIATHRGALDRKRLVDRVSKKYTPARFIAAARSGQDFHGGTLSGAAAKLLVNTYNAGLAAEKRLPE